MMRTSCLDRGLSSPHHCFPRIVTEGLKFGAGSVVRWNNCLRSMWIHVYVTRHVLDVQFHSDPEKRGYLSLLFRSDRAIRIPGRRRLPQPHLYDHLHMQDLSSHEWWTLLDVTNISGISATEFSFRLISGRY